jgi:hypothetical protein
MMCPGRIAGVAATIAMLACSESGAQQPEVSASPPHQQSAPRQALDLRVPDITTLFSAQQLQKVLDNTVDADMEEVEVKGARNRSAVPPATPTVWGGLLAPLWAVTHPTQAWRIFAPLPPDQARALENTKPEATDPYRPAAPLP